ncbi:Uncharacterized protein FKW44_007063, partial [Caligus rogercresseyi]
NNPDVFCYICGEYTLIVKRAYMAYYKVKLALHTVCKTCGAKTSLKFGIPMVWREPFDHATVCYFCAINTTGINRKNRQSLQYPDLPSARRPVAHCEDIPVPMFTKLPDSDDEATITDERGDTEEFEYKHKMVCRPFHILVEDFLRSVGLQTQREKSTWQGRAYHFLCRRHEITWATSARRKTSCTAEMLIKDTEFPKLHEHARVRRVEIVCAGGEQLLGEHEGSNHARLISTMIEAFQNSGKFPENLGAMSDEQEKGSIRTCANGGEVPGEVGRSHDGGLLLVAEARQHSICSHTGIEETPIYA